MYLKKPKRVTLDLKFGGYKKDSKSLNYASDLKNVKISDCLTHINEWQAAELPLLGNTCLHEMPYNGNKLKQIFHFKNYGYQSWYVNDRLMLVDEHNDLYATKLYRLDTLHLIKKNVGKKVKFVNYFDGEKDLLLILTDSAFYCFDGDELVKIDSPIFKKVCCYGGRVFGLNNGRRLWFSDNLDVTNWNLSLDEGGFIEFHDSLGQTLDLVEYKGYLYVIREYGICRVTANNEQENFNVDTVVVNCTKIVKNTVAVVSDMVLLWTIDGLKAFDGFNMKSIFENYKSVLKPCDNTVVANYKGKYLLSGNINFAGVTPDNLYNLYDNNVLLMFDVSNGQVEVVSDINITSMVSIPNVKDEYIYFTIDGKSKMYKFDEMNQMTVKSSYKTCVSDLGVCKRKLLREVNFYSKYESVLIINTDNKVRKYNICGSENKQTIKVNSNFNNISFEFASNNKIKFENFKMVVDFI